MSNQEAMGHINRELYLIRLALGANVAGDSVASGNLPTPPPPGTGEEEGEWYGTGGTDTSEIDPSLYGERFSEICQGAHVAWETHAKIALFLASSGYNAGAVATGAFVSALTAIIASATAFPPALPFALLIAIGAIGISTIFWNAAEYEAQAEWINSNKSYYVNGMSQSTHPREFWEWFRTYAPEGHEATDKAISSYLSWLTLTFRWSEGKTSIQPSGCLPLDRWAVEIRQDPAGPIYPGSVDVDPWTNGASVSGGVNAGYIGQNTHKGIYAIRGVKNGSAGNWTVGGGNNMTQPAKLRIENLFFTTSDTSLTVRVWKQPKNVTLTWGVNVNEWDTVLGLPDEITVLQIDDSSEFFGTIFSLSASGLWNGGDFYLDYPIWLSGT